MQQLHGSRRDSDRKPATLGDSERHAATPWNWKRELETTINNVETVSDMQQERQPKTMEDSERKPATMGDCERHSTTPWH